jgi:hypothetical protein
MIKYKPFIFGFKKKKKNKPKQNKNTHIFKENEPLVGKSEMHTQLMQLVNIIS